MKNRLKNKGFTLIELLVVISIIAILSTVTVIGYTSFVKKAAISNDEVLTQQVNGFLNALRVNKIIDDEPSIAKALKSTNINSNVNIETKKYDMDIYYNTHSNRFELMSKNDGENNNYKNLHYYLNYSDTNIDVDDPSNENNDNLTENEKNTINFTINYSYEEKFNYATVSGNTQRLTAKFDSQNILIIEMLIEEGTTTAEANTIDLSKIVSADDASGTLLEVNFDCKEKYIINKSVQSHKLNGSMLKIYTPGMYEITYSCGDQSGTLNLLARNVCYNDPEITVEEIQYSAVKINDNQDGTHDLVIKTSKNSPNYREQIQITDYFINRANYSSIKLSEEDELMKSIYVLVEYDNKTFEYLMSDNVNVTTKVMSITVDSIILTESDTLSITYIYLGINGTLVTSTTQIITMDLSGIN